MPSLLELGFATFFLNRTNRSGILNAGVIGGIAQNGNWKMDVRYNKDALIQRIRLIPSRKSDISLYQKDAAELLLELNETLPKRSLVYLDPPYYVKGAGLYRNFYKHEDHVEIEKVISTMDDLYWIVSYDNVPEIKKIYKL